MTKFQKFMMNCILIQFVMFISIMYKVMVILAMGHGSAADAHKGM